MESPLKLPPSEAANHIFRSLTDEGYSNEEKIAIRKELDILIRGAIDADIHKLQTLRTSI